MRLVLDTNILISAFIWGGAPHKLLEQAKKDRCQLFTSAALLKELEEVLKRKKFSSLLSSKNITPLFLVQRYGVLSKLVKPAVITPISRDKKDNIVIETALAAQADIIVTGDQDLLLLNPYQKIQILTTAETLKVLQADLH